MKFSNLKVGTRLSLGFGVLLLACMFVGGISWLRLAQLEDVIIQMTSVDAAKAQLTLEMQVRTRTNFANAGRILMAGNDQEFIAKVKEEISEVSKANGEGMEKLEKLVVAPEAKAL